jgi:hypothetical protein
MVYLRSNQAAPLEFTWSLPSVAGPPVLFVLWQSIHLRGARLQQVDQNSAHPNAQSLRSHSQRDRRLNL